VPQHLTFAVISNQRKFDQFSEHTKRGEWEIHGFAGSVAGKAIGYGDVRLRVGRSGFHRNHEVVARNIWLITEAHNSLSQLPLMDQGL
jgi:hypothetical protein